MDLHSEKLSEHVQWQTSSEQEPLELQLPRETPQGTPQVYEDSLDFASALLQRYEPALASSPPATWHSPRQAQDYGAPIPHSQPSKRAKSELTGKYHRFSPNNLLGEKRQIMESPVRKLQPLKELQNPQAAVAAPATSTLTTAPDEFELSDEEEEPSAVHPDLLIHWSQPHMHRYIIYSVTSKENAKVLWCRHQHGFVTLELVKSWQKTKVKEGDIINLVGDFTPAAQITVDHSMLLVVQPDMLVPVTTIAESFSCNRQVLLRQRVRFASPESSIYLLYGNIIHEAIQSCLLDGKFSHKRLTDLFATLVELYLQDLVLLDKTAALATKELSDRIPHILKWAELYVRFRADYDCGIYRQSKRLKVGINKSAYTELEHWSPQYGILGKVDAVVEVQSSEGKRFAGLEIKTGRQKSQAHRAQSCLYTLLLQERFGSRMLPYTLLYYSEDAEMKAVPALKDEVRALIQKRNEIVEYLKNPHVLPPPLKDSVNYCTACFVRPACTLYAAAYQEIEGIDPAPEISTLVADDTTNVDGTHLEFLENWDRALSEEELVTPTSLKRVWCLSALQRESAGFSLVGFRIKSQHVLSDEAGGRNFVYEMERQKPFPKNSRLLAGSNVYVSNPTVLCLASGRITHVHTSTLFVACSQPIDLVATDISINLNESKQFMSYSRGNLLSIFAPEQSKLLRLVIDQQAPQFTSIDYQFQGSFNDDQRAAISKVMNAQDYTIIRGMPGTGKTTAIVTLCTLLAEQGKSVLLAGYTNSAVDNIVLKLMRKNISVLRLGNSPGSIHPDVHEVAAFAKSPRSRHDLADIYEKPPIIATTSLSLTSWIFRIRRFDYCIVDEASQLTLPACLGALSFANKFVLVGDDYQLKPIVKSKNAREFGLGKSLFEYLAESHPSSVANLTQQYRMNQDIMKLSSELVYNGLLKCANDQVANQRLHLKLSPFIKTPPWMDPSNSVVFVNIDELPNCQETETVDGCFNECEAKLAAQMVTSFIQNGLDGSQIGVISPYNVQVKKLTELISQIHSKVECLTADKAQGRDKECIIISLVRSNEEGRVGSLLRDWRRINVVFTRAKCKLVIIGSRQTLKSAEPLEKFLKVIESHNWIWTAA